jgi:hypothetical protein
VKAVSRLEQAEASRGQIVPAAQAASGAAAGAVVGGAIPNRPAQIPAERNSQKIPNLARTGPLTWLRARTTSSTLAPVRRGAATAHLVDLPVDVLWPVGRIIARAEKRLILS